MADEPPGWKPWAIGQVQAFLATVIGGAGSLAFVAFAGAAVLWARAYALGLPPDQVVAAVPQRELVATGASTLTGFGLLGLVAAGAVYLFDRHGVPSRPTRIGLLVLVGIEIAVALYYADPSTGNVVVSVLYLVVVLSSLAAVGLLLGEAVTPAPAPPPPGGAAAGPAPPPPGPAVGAAAPPVALAPPDVRLGLAGAALTAFLILTAVLGIYPQYDEWWLTAAVASAFAAYLVILAVARSSGRRYWGTGVAVVAGVAMFGAVLATLRYTQTKQVQPMAALRTGEGAPVCGIFVAEADDRLFLARLDRDRAIAGPTEDGAAGHLFWLDRKAIVGWTLGALQSQEDAEVALTRLAARVLDERRVQVKRTQTDEQKLGEDAVKHSATTSTTLPPPFDEEAPACTIYAK